MVAIGAFALASFRAGPTAAAAPAHIAPASTMTAADDGAPVATAAPLPERPHLVDRRPDRTVDGLVTALALLLLLRVGVAGHGRRGLPATAGATSQAGPPPATRAWHRRGPPLLHLT